MLKVVVSEGQQRGSLFAPIHWSAATASSARIGELVMPDTDRYSGQPDSKATPATIAPVDFCFRGFALSRQPLQLPEDTWWVCVALQETQGVLLASNDRPAIWRSRARTLFGDDVELAEYADERRGIYRTAAFAGPRLTGCLFIGPADNAPQWDAVKTLFTLETIEEEARRVLLSGRSTDGIRASGPIVCTCFGVGLASIRDAIAAGTALSAQDIGNALRAGTKCGSCLPELKRIVAQAQAAPAPLLSGRQSLGFIAQMLPPGWV